MTVWCHLPTIFKQRRILQIVGLLMLCVALITTLFFSVTARAQVGTNQTISFQGRLLDTQGNAVPDGYYNIQFKIYQDGDGKTAGNPSGSLKWTETYINNGGNNGVFVKNGYLSVDLGSQNPFGTSIDWNQDTLWLSMNVAGSSTVCTNFGTAPCLADGEMLPMKRLTASPYALNSAKLGGKTANDFIQNGTSQQTGDFNISGTGIAATIQGNTSVIAPLFDSTTTNSTLSIGTVNASTINMGTNEAQQDINIGTSTGATKNVTIGSVKASSLTTIQGGDSGVVVNTNGGFVVHNQRSGTNLFAVDSFSGDIGVNLQASASLKVTNSVNNDTLLSVLNDGTITTGLGTALNIEGVANFGQGITIQGVGGTLRYTTPGGASLSTAINIPNYTVPAYGSILSFGLPSTSAATARGMLVADGRTSAHQATIGVLSPDENQIMGLSWDGSNSTGRLSNTANSLALQGNGLDLLTATNNGGKANVGIGNSASSGYALDVTGDINASSQYRINGVAALTSSALTFSGASTSSIASASGQSLDLNGSTDVNISVNGNKSASFTQNGLQIGDASGTGQPKLLTVDRAGSTPTATGDAVLGSMYYDTTIGKLQCYEADGWGACSSSPDSFISLNPQYSNAVTNGSGTGNLTSDFCSDELNINDGSASQPTICGTNETYNFYNWTSSQATSQSKSIYVTYQLPNNFKEFIAGSTSLKGRTDGSNANVNYQVYKKTASGLTACGSSVATSTGAQTTWQTGTASGSADPSTCSFAAGDSVVFKVTLSAYNNANAYASTLNFAFSNS